MNDNDDALTESNSGESFVLFGDWRDEALLDAIGEALVLERQRERTKREDPPLPFVGRLPSCGGQVSALLTLLQGAKAEVIGLPRKRPSDAA